MLSVDLTAEFPERRLIREGREYVAAPMLVARRSCATVQEAVQLLRSVRPGLDLGKDQLAFACRMCSEGQIRVGHPREGG